MKSHPCRPHPVSGHDAIAGPNYAYWGGSNLYVNLTSRCSASCTFCLRNRSYEVYGYDLYLDEAEEPDALRVIDAVQKAWEERMPSEVVFTGLGEPTLRFDVLLSVLRYLRARGVRSRIDTNGHAALVNPGRDVVQELSRAGLEAASVSLNAPDEEAYDRLCRPAVAGAFDAVGEFVRRASTAGIEVTATAVALPGVDLERTALLAESLGVPFRVRPFVGARTAAGEA